MKFRLDRSRLKLLLCLPVSDGVAAEPSSSQRHDDFENFVGNGSVSRGDEEQNEAEADNENDRSKQLVDSGLLSLVHPVSFGVRCLGL